MEKLVTGTQVVNYVTVCHMVKMLNHYASISNIIIYLLIADRLPEIATLAEEKKWSQVQGIITGPLGTLLQTL